MPKRTSQRRKSPPQRAMRTNGDYQRCAERLKALADPERLRIVDCLFGGPKNVTQLACALSDDVVKVSHHLGVLRHANVVQAHRQGKFVVYSLDPDIDGSPTGDIKTLDLGCCWLDLPQPDKKK